MLLPVLPPGDGLRLTPTDITQFVRMEQCERFLRFRLAERARQEFMEGYGVKAQRITPLLSLSGRTFEEGVEEQLDEHCPTTNFAARAKFSHNRPENNTDVVAAARSLKRGHTTVLLQARIEAP